MLLSELLYLLDIPSAPEIAGTFALSHEYKQSENKYTIQLETQSYSVEI